MSMDKQAVIVLSGGLDSTVLLHSTLQEASPEALLAVSFNYGQRHAVELSFAKRTCEKLGVKHVIVDLSSLQPLLASALTFSTEVPTGLYDESNMAITVVPNRNMIMASIAAGIAQSGGYSRVLMGMHAGDHAVYPDCRPQFVMAASLAILAATDKAVTLEAPFLYMSKTDIVREGARLGVDWSLTWSCYSPVNGMHCGRCGTCTERIEAFYTAGVIDTTQFDPEGHMWALQQLRLAGKIS